MPIVHDHQGEPVAPPPPRSPAVRRATFAGLLVLIGVVVWTAPNWKLLNSLVPAPSSPAAAPRARAPLRRARVSLTGRCVDENGRPVAGAVVTLHHDRENDGEPWVSLPASPPGDGAPRTTTDADGAFAFHDAPVPLGTMGNQQVAQVELHAEAPGRAFSWSPSRSAPVHIEDAAIPGQTPRGSLAYTAIVTMPPPRPIRRRLVDDFGEPITGADVAITAAYRWRRAATPGPSGLADDVQNRGGRRMVEALPPPPSGTTPPIALTHEWGWLLATTKSDDQGWFEVATLPGGCVYLTEVDLWPVYGGPRTTALVCPHYLDVDADSRATIVNSTRIWKEGEDIQCSVPVIPNPAP